MIHADITSHMDLVLEEQRQTDIFRIDMQIFNKMFQSYSISKKILHCMKKVCFTNFLFHTTVK